MNAKEFGLAVLVTAIWGTNFSFIKLGLSAIDPFLLAAMRFFFCAVPAIFFVKRPPIAWRYLVGYGLSFGVLQWGMVYAAIQFGLSAGLASVITQTAVFFTMLFGVLFFKEKLSAPLVVGTLIAFCGVGLIFFYTDDSTTVLGLSLRLGGAMGWALANVVVKKSEATDMFGFMIWSSVVAPLPLLALSLAFSGTAGIRASITHFDLIALASLLFQVYPTTLLGYSIWNHLLTKYSVSTVAPLALLVPVFGMLGSVIIFKEGLPAYKLAAIGLIFSGLLVHRFGGRFLVRA